MAGKRRPKPVSVSSEQVIRPVHPPTPEGREPTRIPTCLIMCSVSDARLYLIPQPLLLLYCK